ncbi:MAG: glycosyltransferase family 4 protein [Sphingomonas sp.]
MRILFALPGFHAQDRGAEVALLAVARELAGGGDAVTVMGGGPERPDEPYRFVHVPIVDRLRFERAPKVPPFRSETVWEDATFGANLLTRYRPKDFDVAITCNFPFTHLALRRPTFGDAPLQIFVTQNGDWAARSDKAEFRLFRCDGLVCTNPDYQEANKGRWRTALIPNGIVTERYDGVASDRAGLGLPDGVPIVLMVSALVETKRVADGIRAVAKLPDAHLVVAGDGPLRTDVDALAAQLLPGRFTRLTLTAPDMPRLYASADAFLHMSLLESFGNVFVEAMASGLPIVGHDTPRLRWIVGDRETLCNTENLDAVADAVRRALAIGRGAQDPRSAEFGWPSIAARYRSFITELLERRNAA